MAREDFVTTPPRKGLRYPKTHKVRAGSVYAPKPRIVVVLDPERMPDEIASALEGPDGFEFIHAVVEDRHFESESESLADALELRAQTRDEIADGPRWCAVCKKSFMFRGLDFFWNGMPLCSMNPCRACRSLPVPPPAAPLAKLAHRFLRS